MSEFKFEVGQRVSFTCAAHGYHRGTIATIKKSFYYGGPLYKIKRDKDGGECFPDERELTRLVKKNPWGNFKVGQRVLADSRECGVFAGRIVELTRFTLTSNRPALKIKPEDSLNLPYGATTWIVSVKRCKLIEDEKPKQREPLRVGERVVVKPDENKYVRSGQKGKVIEIFPGNFRHLRDTEYYKIEFTPGDWQCLRREQLKRLIKKPRKPLQVGERVICNFLYGQKDKGVIIDLINDGVVVKFAEGARAHMDYNRVTRLIKKPAVFKVGDKVRVNKVSCYPDVKPFTADVINVYEESETLKVKIKTEKDYWVYMKDCVRLRKKPKVFAVGDRVSFFKHKATFERCSGTVTSVASAVKLICIRRDKQTAEMWHEAVECRKLRKRRLRVGDRVNGLTYKMHDKITGKIIKDDKSETPFLIRCDRTGLVAWCKAEDCKRLVRKKKEKKEGMDFQKIIKHAREFMEKMRRDKQDHVPASGKKVEGDKLKVDEEFIKRFRKPEKEKHVCNPALWETQCIKNIATSKLINELCRKVERLETTRAICGLCRNLTSPFFACPRCDGSGVEKN